MKCTCVLDTEKAYREHVQASNADVTVLSVTILGKVWSLAPECELVGTCPIEVVIQAKRKNGAIYKKTEQTSIRWNYCPFCGLDQRTSKPERSDAEGEEVRHG